MTVRAAMSEIVRVGGWSLRGLGFKFGVAERGIPFIVWAEAVHGQAIRCLRLTESRVNASSTNAAPSRVREDETSWLVNANRKHLVEIGPTMVDLLTSDVRRHGHAYLDVDETFGMYLAPALCALAAQRNFTCIAVYRGDADDLVPEGFPPSGWIAACPAKGGSVFAGAPIGPDIAASIQHLIPPGSDFFDSHNAALTSMGESCLRLFGFVDPRAAERWKANNVQQVDFADRLHLGYQQGVPMEEVDLAYLYALERRTWAPTSERSRSQAGYGKF